MLIRYFILLFSLALMTEAGAQTLQFRKDGKDLPGGRAFARSISDTSLSLKQREKIVYRMIKRGDLPGFLRTLTPASDSALIKGRMVHILYYVASDYLSIGNDTDFLYMPMTPMLAQRVASKLHCSLPTRKMSDNIYRQATIKLVPQPILPSAAMITVPVFLAHTDSVMKQLSPFRKLHSQSALTAGDKKDIVISNKIYGAPTPRVVIYGWHKPDGKAIQPLYNKHKNTWADYSHGVRLVQNKVFVDGKPSTLQKVLADPDLCLLLSDEGVIDRDFYPVEKHY
ncbi:MAG TPA: hypothetical protein VGM31_02615 [Puia sp.]|jgi:hypothetical protein